MSETERIESLEAAIKAWNQHKPIQWRYHNNSHAQWVDLDVHATSMIPFVGSFDWRPKPIPRTGYSWLIRENLVITKEEAIANAKQYPNGIAIEWKEIIP